MRTLSDETLQHLRAIGNWPDVSATAYRLVRLLGQGGMGMVFEAHDTKLGRAVALKVVAFGEEDADAGKRLNEEARVTARLEHPGIVPVHDAGVLAGGQFYYAMKLVQGQRLDQIPWQQRSLAQRLRVFLQICDACAFAHSRNILHLDLKPGNIMIGSFGEVLILDWGAARSSIAGARQTGVIIGTPGYMPPEQAKGRLDLVDERSDIYSLGAVLGFLLTGAPSAPPPKGHDRIPRPLAAVCRKALGEEPGLRYASVDDLSSDIGRFLEGLPPRAYREPVWERAGRLIARNQTLALMIAAYLLLRVILLFAMRR